MENYLLHEETVDKLEKKITKIKVLNIFQIDGMNLNSNIIRILSNISLYILRKFYI